MIPNNITRQHIIQAFDFINKNRIPTRRSSRNWYVLYHKKKYPPKYTISVANIFANGNELDFSTFVTTEAVAYLTILDFNVLQY